MMEMQMVEDDNHDSNERTWDRERKGNRKKEWSVILSLHLTEI